MDFATISLLSLVLGVVGATVGSFAYLTGETRKLAAHGREEVDALRDYLNGRVDAISKEMFVQRDGLRSEFLAATTRIEMDLRRIVEQTVRRADMEAAETRLTRTSERLEQKVESIILRLPPPIRQETRND